MQKGVYLHEYVDDWKKFNETSLPEKEDLYSQLNMEDIIDADYAQAKIIFENFEKKKLRKILFFVCSKWYIIVIWCTWEH